MSDLLSAESIICGYGGEPVIKDISLDVSSGDFVGIVGANGSGKTTLLRALSGLLKLDSGFIKVNGKWLGGMKRRDIAKHMAFVPQLMEPTPGFSVEDMVLLGRTPYLDRFSFEDDRDYRIAKWAIEQLRVDDLGGRDVSSLSGGEFQRVAIARALAQEPKTLLLDEPTSHLDLRFQMKILRLLRKLRENRSIIATFHDLNLAARYCKKVILLKKGEVVAQGRPDDVFTADNIWDAYRVRMNIRKNPKNGKLRINLP
jgi:iron complex transport system ATP-binding protein